MKAREGGIGSPRLRSIRKMKERDKGGGRERMQTCITKFLKKGEGPKDLEPVMELTTKPFKAFGACTKPRTAKTSRLAIGPSPQEGGKHGGGKREEGTRPIGPLDRWVTSLGKRSGPLSQAEAKGETKVEGRLSLWEGGR